MTSFPASDKSVSKPDTDEPGTEEQTKPNWDENMSEHARLIQGSRASLIANMLLPKIGYSPDSPFKRGKIKSVSVYNFTEKNISTGFINLFCKYYGLV